MQIIENWLNDIPQQFVGKDKIEVLIGAFARQLQDIEDASEALKNLTDLSTATGQNLDMVGTIVSPTRKEAAELASADETVIDDETYRKYLTYKIWKNTNSCTYYDIINSFKMFWDKPLHYSESTEQPAMMILETDELSASDDANKLLTAPFVKAAGVAIKVIAYTKTEMPTAAVPVFSAMGRSYESTTLLEI